VDVMDGAVVRMGEDACMSGCVVEPDAHVSLADGAVAVDCVFTSCSRVSIGKGSSVRGLRLSGFVDVGRDSRVFSSRSPDTGLRLMRIGTMFVGRKAMVSLSARGYASEIKHLFVGDGSRIDGLKAEVGAQLHFGRNAVVAGLDISVPSRGTSPVTFHAGDDLTVVDSQISVRSGADIRVGRGVRIRRNMWLYGRRTVIDDGAVLDGDMDELRYFVGSMYVGKGAVLFASSTSGYRERRPSAYTGKLSIGPCAVCDSSFVRVNPGCSITVPGGKYTRVKDG